MSDHGEISACPFCGCKVTLLTGREDHRVAGNHQQFCPFLDLDVVVDSQAAWDMRATSIDTTPGSTLKVMRGPCRGLYLSGVEDLREGDVFRREVRG